MIGNPLARAKFKFAAEHDGVVITLEKQPLIGPAISIALTEWHKSAPTEALAMTGRVMDWIDDQNGMANPRGDEVIVAHKAIASLSVAQARVLSLPETTPHVLALKTSGRITEPEFQLSASWRDRAERPVPSSRIGAILRVGSVNYRIPDPLFAIIEEVDRYNAQPAPSKGERYAALAHLQEALPAEASQQVQAEGAIGSFRIVHAVAFSLSLRQEEDGIHFDPVLFGRHVAKRSVGGNEELVNEAESLLPEARQEVFANRFRQWEDARSAYPLSEGAYVYVDEALKPVLDAVRKKQNAGPETRWAFARNPQAALREAQIDDAVATDIEQVFIETEQYSQRVIEIGLWKPPVLPWIKSIPNNWLPERFGIRVGDRYVSIDQHAVGDLVDKVQAAINKDEPTVKFQDQEIPASSETLGHRKSRNQITLAAP